MSTNGRPIPLDVVARHSDRFWSKVDTSAGPNACWPYTGGCHLYSGYGVFYASHLGYRAHRFAFTAAKGPIGPSLVVRHTCDNPPCCNPAHLVDGTQEQNVHDSIARRRAVLIQPSPGSANGMAHLTESEVEEIRRRYAEGERGMDLADEYGVARSSISRAVNRKLWTHVT